MRLFVADVFLLYALTTIPALEKTVALTIIASRRHFVLPVVTLYYAVALIVFPTQAGDVTLISALKLIRVATVLGLCLFVNILTFRQCKIKSLPAQGGDFIRCVIAVHDSVALERNIETDLLNTALTAEQVGSIAIPTLGSKFIGLVVAMVNSIAEELFGDTL